MTMYFCITTGWDKNIAYELWTSSPLWVQLISLMLVISFSPLTNVYENSAAQIVNIYEVGCAPGYRVNPGFTNCPYQSGLPPSPH